MVRLPWHPVVVGQLDSGMVTMSLLAAVRRRLGLLERAVAGPFDRHRSPGSRAGRARIRRAQARLVKFGERHEVAWVPPTDWMR